MESTSFKSILDKFKQGANSMEEVYSELTYLTTNYDKEIEKLQKELEDEKVRANNEQFVRHEAEKSLEDLRKLQEINFSVIVEGLIEKPKEEFELQLRSSIKKFTVSIIFLTIISVSLIVASFFYFPKNNIQKDIITNDSNDMNKIILEMKTENEEQKKFIQENLPEKKENKNDEIIIPMKESLNEEIEKKEIEEEKPEIKEDIKTTNQNKEELLDKVLTIIVSYDKKFKLSGKNNSRLLYKMFLLDLAPFKHDLILQEINLFAKNYTYVPSKEELLIWDKQMLYIYTQMLEKIENIPDSKITSNMRNFNNYKKDDATLYSGWEYLGESNLSMKESLEKEIKKLNNQIKLNSN